MSMSRYELQMLEEKRKQEELDKEKKKVGLIISVVVIIIIVGATLWFVNTCLTNKIDEIEASTTKEVAKPKD